MEEKELHKHECDCDDECCCGEGECCCGDDCECGDGCECGHSHEIQKLKQNEHSHIKHVIGIVSGKGGVGKSFVTSLLARELNKKGYKVGILDGDITGPSIPKSFNIHEQAEGDGVKYIYPAVTSSGIKIISSNMLLENEDDPIVWRGTLISSLLRQFYTDVLWEELDYLLIDMPPGTGDVTLTAFQEIPLDGIIIVTSPQDLVKMVVSKAINMAKMMKIKVIGVVENFSYAICPKCGEHIEVYGVSHLEEICKNLDVKGLAKLPINAKFSTLIDEGKIEEISLDEFENVVKEIINL